VCHHADQVVDQGQLATLALLCLWPISTPLDSPCARGSQHHWLVETRSHGHGSQIRAVREALKTGCGTMKLLSEEQQDVRRFEQAVVGSCGP
jgi:hypothetical protein